MSSRAHSLSKESERQPEPGPTAASRVALVTGATGFLGSRLSRRLLESGWEVHAVVRPGSDLFLLGDAKTLLRLAVHDGGTEGLVRIVKESGPDVCFHLASLFLSQHATTDVVPLVQSNVLFGSQLAEALAVSGVRRVVGAGTSWQHFDGLPYGPVNLYAATKQASEDIFRYYAEAGHFGFVALKFHDNYGPGDPRLKLFALLRQAARTGTPLAMSPGEQFIDTVYVDDAVEALLAAERSFGALPAAFRSYAVSSGSPIRLRELVALYAKIIGRPVPVSWEARPYRFREMLKPWKSGEPVPGWRPVVDLAEGIRRMEEHELQFQRKPLS